MDGRGLGWLVDGVDTFRVWRCHVVESNISTVRLVNHTTRARAGLANLQTAEEMADALQSIAREQHSARPPSECPVQEANPAIYIHPTLSIRCPYFVRISISGHEQAAANTQSSFGHALSQVACHIVLRGTLTFPVVLSGCGRVYGQRRS